MLEHLTTKGQNDHNDTNDINDKGLSVVMVVGVFMVVLSFTTTNQRSA